MENDNMNPQGNPQINPQINPQMNPQEININVNMVQQPVNPGSGKATAALVLGILSLTGCLSILSIPAIILAVVSRKDTGGKMSGKAIGGLVCSLLAIGIGLVIVVVSGGMMVPQMNKYISKSHVASDVQTLNQVKTAFFQCLIDPSLSLPDFEEGDYDLEEFLENCGEDFADSFVKTMNMDADEINGQLLADGHDGTNKSNGIHVLVEEDSIIFYIPNSCFSGNGSRCTQQDEISVSIDLK